MQGIVVRDRRTGQAVFYIKGADAVMAPMVRYNDWLEEECGNLAREGLRTLVVARKHLSDAMVTDFLTAYVASMPVASQERTSDHGPVRRRGWCHRAEGGVNARRYAQAKLVVHGRALAMQEVIAAKLETDLDALALTGVEDKLQVPGQSRAGACDALEVERFIRGEAKRARSRCARPGQRSKFVGDVTKRWDCGVDADW